MSDQDERPTFIFQPDIHLRTDGDVERLLEVIRDFNKAFPVFMGDFIDRMAPIVSQYIECYNVALEIASLTNRPVEEILEEAGNKGSTSTSSVIQILRQEKQKVIQRLKNG